MSTEKPEPIHVAAVALLLSQVAQDWRTMESPLFDTAGDVVGRIKTAARITGCQAADTLLKQAATLKGSEAVNAMHDPETEKNIGERLSSPDKRKRGHRTCAMCCRGGRLCCRPAQFYSKRTAAEICRISQRPDLPDVRHTPSRHEDIHPVSERSGGRVLHLVIIEYRGLKMPFRWYSGTSAEAIDTSLRETLGRRHAILKTLDVLFLVRFQWLQARKLSTTV